MTASRIINDSNLKELVHKQTMRNISNTRRSGSTDDDSSVTSEDLMYYETEKKFIDEYTNNDNSIIQESANISRETNNFRSKLRKENRTANFLNKLFRIIKTPFFLHMVVGALIFALSFLFEDYTFSLSKQTVQEEPEEGKDTSPVYKVEHEYKLKGILQQISVMIVLCKLMSYIIYALSTIAISKISMLVYTYDESISERGISMFHPLNLFYSLRSASYTFTLLVLFLSLYVKLNVSDDLEQVLLGEMTVGDAIISLIVISAILVVKSVIIGLLNREYTKDSGMREKIAIHTFLRFLQKCKVTKYYRTPGSKNSASNEFTYFSNRNSIININQNNRTTSVEIQGQQTSSATNLAKKEVISLQTDPFLKFLHTSRSAKLDERNQNLYNISDLSDLISEKETTSLMRGKKARNILNTTYEKIEDVKKQSTQRLDQNVRKTIISSDTRTIREMEGVDRKTRYQDLVEKRRNPSPTSDLRKRNKYLISNKREENSSSLSSESHVDTNTNKEDSSSIDIEESEQREKGVDNFQSKISHYKCDLMYFRTATKKYTVPITFNNSNNSEEMKVNETTFPLIHQMRILMLEQPTNLVQHSVYENTLLFIESRNIFEKYYSIENTRDRKHKRAEKISERILMLMQANNCNNLEELVCLRSAYTLNNNRPLHIHNKKKERDFSSNKSSNNCEECQTTEINITNNKHCLQLYNLYSWWNNEYPNTTRSSLKKSVYDFLTGYHNMITSIDNMKHCIYRLNNFLLFLIITYLVAVVFSKVFRDSKASFVEVIAATLGSSFIIAEPAKKGIDCLIFLFCIHPYDVGDRVFLHIKGKTSPRDDGLHQGLENLVVKQLNIFSTTFEKFDGTELIIYNDLLMKEYILNTSRSGHMMEIHYLNVSRDTEFSRLDKLKNRIKGFLKEDKSFRDYFTFNYERIDRNMLFIKIFISYKDSCSNYVLYLRNRNRFVEFLNQEVVRLGVKYQENVQRVQIVK